MKMTKVGIGLVALFIAGPMAACGSDDEGGGDGDGDGSSAPGDGDGSGGDGDGPSDDDALDQGALSENCNDVSPEAGQACDEPGLVCADASESTCVCGGFEATPGGDFGGGDFDGGDFDDFDFDDFDFGGPGGFDDPNPGSGVWECFGIGTSAMGGAGGLGGATASGGTTGTGGADGSGGDAPLGGQGGDSAP